jgi:uncharacterized protein YndB with AHSA1/START domain
MEDSGDLELAATRLLPYPPVRVWAACTRKELLERWWSPEDLRTTVRRLDVRPGGDVVFHVRYVPALLTKDAAESFRAARIPISFDIRGTFTEVILERLLTFDLTLELGKAGAGVNSVTRLELIPEDSGTRVNLIAGGKGTPHWKTLGRQNLDAQLERLERALDASPGTR